MAEFHVHIDATRLDDSFERRLRETLAVRGESPSAFDERNCLPESVDFSCYFSTFSSQLRGGTRIVTKVLTREALAKLLADSGTSVRVWVQTGHSGPGHRDRGTDS